MPNRILRDWTDSDTVDKLTVDAERFFTRLIMKADDFGRYFAEAKRLKSFLFPLKDSIRDTDICRWLAECEKVAMIRCYDAAGKRYLEICDFRQRLRQMREIYPAPDWSVACQTDDGHAADIRPLEENPNPNPNPNPNRREEEVIAALAPSLKLSDVFDAWEAIAINGLPRCLVLSDKRRRTLQVRLGEPFFRENWTAAMEKCSTSPFLKGDSDGGWRASFDWFIKPDSVAKIMEGKYDAKIKPHLPHLHNLAAPAPKHFVTGQIDITKKAKV